VITILIINLSKKSKKSKKQIKRIELDEKQLMALNINELKHFWT
jgi:hypothetical protein